MHALTQPNIEPFSQACLPLIEPLFPSLTAYAATHSPELNVVVSGIHEKGPVLANASLCFESAPSPLPDVMLGVGLYLSQMTVESSLWMRFQVGWYRSWSQDEQAGFSIYEFSASAHFTDSAAAAHWTSAQLPRVRSAAQTAIRRGHPPRLMQHIWQRLTRRIPRPMIMTLPSCGLTKLPNLETFVSLYERPHVKTKGC